MREKRVFIALPNGFFQAIYVIHLIQTSDQFQQEPKKKQNLLHK